MQSEAIKDFKRNLKTINHFKHSRELAKTVRYTQLLNLTVPQKSRKGTPL